MTIRTYRLPTRIPKIEIHICNVVVCFVRCVFSTNVFFIKLCTRMRWLTKVRWIRRWIVGTNICFFTFTLWILTQRRCIYVQFKRILSSKSESLSFVRIYCVLKTDWKKKKKKIAMFLNQSPPKAMLRVTVIRSR